MATVTKLIGRTDILGAIYNDDFLPTAIMTAGHNPREIGTQPACLHSLRCMTLPAVDAMFKNWATEQGIEPKDIDANLKLQLFHFYEQFPQQDYHCVGCSTASKTGSNDVTKHRINTTADAATRLAEDCA